MQIIRYLDPSGLEKYASLQAAGTAREISGDILGEFSVTGKVAAVTKRLAPIVPTNLLCIGLNYRHHAEESKAKIPEFPVVFMKATSSLQNPGDPIILPRHLCSDEVDYECELAVVIGRRCQTSLLTRRWTTYSVTPVPTTSVPVIGKASGEAASGVEERRSTRSHRWGHVSSLPTKSRIPTPWRSSWTLAARCCKTGSERDCGGTVAQSSTCPGRFGLPDPFAIL